MADTGLAFGPFSLDRSGRVLLRDGLPVEAGQRGVALLKALIAAQGGTVTKAELIEAAWPDVVVEEGNLTVQVATLRRLLGSAPDGGEWIVTVPRVGYRLAGQAKAPPAMAPRADALSRHPMLAVLPFQNMSGDPEQEYFADGVVEDIITALSRFRSFAVASRISSFVYKGRAVDVREVGRELGVRYVLEGSVRRAGSTLRITAQLIDADTGAHLWAKTFDGAAEDVFAFQDRITAEVATIVSPVIEQAEVERVRRRPPESLNAYELFLRGLPIYRAATLAKNAESFALFSRAMELDPGYALAICYTATALHSQLAYGGPSLTDDDRANCIALTRRAVALAGGDALILAACGTILANTIGEHEEGVALVDLAVAANPNNPLVMGYGTLTYLHCGDLQQCLEYGHRAVVLHPGRAGAHWILTAIAHAHIALGEYEEALDWAARSLAVNPDFECTYWMLGAANAKLGRMDEASHWVGRLLKLRPDATIAAIRKTQPARYGDERIANMLEGLAAAGLPER